MDFTEEYFSWLLKIPLESKLGCLPKQSQLFCSVFTRQGIMNRDFAVIFIVKYFFHLHCCYNLVMKQKVVNEYFISLIKLILAPSLISSCLKKINWPIFWPLALNIRRSETKEETNRQIRILLLVR